MVEGGESYGCLGCFEQNDFNDNRYVFCVYVCLRPCFLLTWKNPFQGPVSTVQAAKNRGTWDRIPEGNLKDKLLLSTFIN